MLCRQGVVIASAVRRAMAALVPACHCSVEQVEGVGTANKN
jgi:hypothetical protein